MQNSLWGRRRLLLTTWSSLCSLPCQSHKVVLKNCLFFAMSWAHDMADPARHEIPGPSLQWSPNTLSADFPRVRQSPALFTVIYNLVRSWLCGPGGWEQLCLFVHRLQRSRTLLSGRDRCQVSWPPQSLAPPRGQDKDRPRGKGWKGKTQLYDYRILVKW